MASNCLGEASATIPEPSAVIIRRYGPFGNLFFRPMEFPSKGSIVQGHAHKFDHVTFISRGSVRVRARQIGEVRYRSPESTETIAAPEKIVLQPHQLGRQLDEEDELLDSDIIIIEGFGPITDRVYLSPAAICIRKNWMHEFTALEDNTRADCIFALRD